MNLKNNPNLPAGFVDDNVEFFVSNNLAMAVYQGRITPIDALPDAIINNLVDEMHRDKAANKALDELGFNTKFERLEAFIKCRYGAFDLNADANQNELHHGEYWECGFRGKCKHEGKLCSTIKADNGILTPREIQVIKMVAAGYYDKEIAAQLNISEKTLPVHKRNIKSKINASTKTEIAVFAMKNNIYGNVANA